MSHLVAQGRLTRRFQRPSGLAFLARFDAINTSFAEDFSPGEMDKVMTERGSGLVACRFAVMRSGDWRPMPIHGDVFGRAAIRRQSLAADFYARQRLPICCVEFPAPAEPAHLWHQLLESGRACRI